MDLNSTGGLAFPLKEPLSDDALGMTLRDYFAAKALPAAMQCDTHLCPEGPMPKFIAQLCYEVADAMLEARKPPAAEPLPTREA